MSGTLRMLHAMISAQRAIRETVRFRGLDVLFPLTPALSLGERENRSQSLDNPSRGRFSDARAVMLPLPKGEGRGEGEQTVRPPRPLDVTDSHCHRADP